MKANQGYRRPLTAGEPQGEEGWSAVRKAGVSPTVLCAPQAASRTTGAGGGFTAVGKRTTPTTRKT